MQRGLPAAEEGFRLSVVLETIQAEQELTRLRNDYANSVSEFNKAPYALLRAIGRL